MPLQSDIRFSIVIPTYQRRGLVVQAVTSLAGLERPWPCELLVVVDGSTDGTADAAREVPLPFPLRVVEQPNQGAAAARNAGASLATGEFLLFLDDDMVVQPDLLMQHAAVLDAGADAAVGHVPLHPDARRTLLSVGVDRWARRRHARLRRTGGELTLPDLLTGQLSVRRTTFLALGGFDAALTAGGTFGGEDTDFLFRLLESGAQVRYAPDAVSYQQYAVEPDHYLRQWRQAGRADAVLTDKHPALTRPLLEAHGGDRATGRVLRRLVQAVPPQAVEWASHPVLARARAGRTDWPTRWAFARVRDAVYWSGAGEAGGTRPVVLAYHSIEDLPPSRLQDYAVTPEQLEGHLDALSGAGYSFLTADQLLGHLEGRPVPRHSVLLTFDDGFASLETHALPLLARYGAAAVVFLVADQIGGTNVWDHEPGDPDLPLLDQDAVRRLLAAGWEVGSHSRDHSHLVRLGPARRAEQLAGSRRALAALGLPAPRLFAYPYGEHDIQVRRAARRAGYAAAFGLRESSAAVGARRRWALPRVELTRDVSPQRLLELVAAPPRAAGPAVERELRGAARLVLSRAIRSVPGRT